MNQHQDHFITQCLGAGNEIDLGGMGIDRFKAETKTPQQQGFALLLSQERRQKKPVKGAFAGPITAHQQLELFGRNHTLAQPNTGSQWMKMPLRKLPVLRLPSAAKRSSAPGWLAEAW